MEDEGSVERFAQGLSALLERKAPSVANITFMLGAGFSNSWDPRYPTGAELFDMKDPKWLESSPVLLEFLAMMGFPSDELEMDRALFLDVIYQVGMLRKYP